jgi:hypothetical protein
MDVKAFATKTGLDKKRVLEKCIYVAYFLKVVKNQSEFEFDDIFTIFEQLHYPKPTVSKLKRSAVQSRSFIKGSTASHFKLHSKVINRLNEESPELTEKSEDIVSDDTIIPESLYANTRGFIVSLSKQINSSFENNIFDGCAVLMRRLLEVLLILTYEKMGIESEIKQSDGSYMLLNGIVSNATSHNKLGLSRNTKEGLEDFRVIGNFSAHKIYYNAKRKDITSVSKNYRATIEELLYKSGIIK